LSKFETFFKKDQSSPAGLFIWFIWKRRTSFTAEDTEDTEDTENSQRNTDLNAKSSKKQSARTFFNFKKFICVFSCFS